MKKCTLGLAGILTLILLTGCVAPSLPDYSQFCAHHPRSILVPPPLNDSPETEATYGYLSTITRPLAEKGYYVFPVALIDQFFKENGMPTPYEMHQIPLSKIDEIIGADAVLYTRVKNYGTEYIVINSCTIVDVDAKLVDVKTGITLWTGEATCQVSSGDGGGGIIGMLVSAAITQVVSSCSDQAHDLCPQVNAQLLTNKDRGLLYGPHHLEFRTDYLPE